MVYYGYSFLMSAQRDSPLIHQSPDPLQFFPILQGLERIELNICDYLNIYNIMILSNPSKNGKIHNKQPKPPKKAGDRCYLLIL